MFFQLTQYFLSHIGPICDLVESWNVQDSKADKLSIYLKSSAIIKINICGDLLETIGNFDFWVAGEKFGGGTFARAWPSNDQNIKSPDCRHNFK